MFVCTGFQPSYYFIETSTNLYKQVQKISYNLPLRQHIKTFVIKKIHYCIYLTLHTRDESILPLPFFFPHLGRDINYWLWFFPLTWLICNMAYYKGDKHFRDNIYYLPKFSNVFFYRAPYCCNMILDLNVIFNCWVLTRLVFSTLFGDFKI